MKIQDQLTRRIVAAGAVFCAILLCTSVLIYTLNKANAGTDLPGTPVLYQSPSGAEIMMFPFCGLKGEDGKSDAECSVLVYNPNTGKSLIYGYFKHPERGLGWHSRKYQLPANPLP